MIEIRNIRNVRRGQFDEVWAIVRYYRGKSDWITHVPELSPSQLLVARYSKLKLAGEWNKSSFDEKYLPVFLREMKAPAARNKLNELYRADKAGKRIALVCFCADESLCHRSIIAGFLQGVGCDVKTANGADYSGYYQAYMEV